MASLCFERPIYIGLNIIYQSSKSSLFSDIIYNLSVTIYVGSVSSDFKIIATKPGSGYGFVGLAVYTTDFLS